MRRWRSIILLLVVLPLYTWLLMVLGLTACTLLVAPGDVDWGHLVSYFNPYRMWTEDEAPLTFLSFGVPAVLVAATQVAFLLPMVRFTGPVRSKHGRPLWLTFIAAGFVGGLLTFACFGAMGELLQWWEDGKIWPASLLDRSGWDEWALIAAFWIEILIGWTIWSIVLAYAARRIDPNRAHSRLLTLLLGGTIVELLFVIPIDVMVRRRTDCYCGTGTFFALCASVWAVLWLAGPGIVLPLLSRRRRRLAETHCLNCGYARGPSPGKRCPECGGAWP